MKPKNEVLDYCEFLANKHISNWKYGFVDDVPEEKEIKETDEANDLDHHIIKNDDRMIYQGETENWGVEIVKGRFEIGKTGEAKYVLRDSTKINEKEFQKGEVKEAQFDWNRPREVDIMM